MSNAAQQIIDQIQVGSVVRLNHRHGDEYIVCEVKPHTAGLQTTSSLGGSFGLKPILVDYVAINPETLAKVVVHEHSVQGDFEHSGKTEQECQELLSSAEQKHLRDMQNATDKRLAREAEAEAFHEVAKQKMPSWAKAVIVAELMQDESDSQSDYFNSRTTKVIILAFSSHQRDLFPEMRKAALNHPDTAFLADAPEDAEHREKWSMGGGYYLKTDGRHDDGWRISKRNLFYGKAASDHRNIPVGIWSLPDETKAPAPKTIKRAANDSSTKAHIEEHVHTKKNFEMWIVVLDERVDTDRFNELRTACQSMSGWYSRQWGATPGGFAFKDVDQAQSFIDHYLGGEPQDGTTPPSSPAPALGSGAKLRELADKLQARIDDRLRDRQTNTPKRLKEARHAQIEGYQLQRTQTVMLKLADMYDAGTVPSVLTKLKTKAAIFPLMRSKTQGVSNGYHSYSVETGEPSDTSAEALACWALLSDSPEDANKRKLQTMIDQLQFSSIPGYFPTPKQLCERLVAEAGVKDGDIVLEPSAGSGAIMDAVRDAGGVVDGYEVRGTLVEILKLKGHNVEQADFMEVPAIEAFDYVIGNPPFEKMQDIDHALHAFKFLKPGGRMVFVMSPSFTFRSDKKCTAFRDWVEDVGGEVLDLPDGSFKESGTGVSTKLLIVDKE